MADLAAFLAQASRTPFAWDGLNCLTFPADWVLARRGVDLAEGFRGRVRTALGAKRFLARAGGLLAFAQTRAAACGLEPIDDPKAGDVGVVAIWDGEAVKPAGAICAGRRWVVIERKRLLSAPMQPVMAWRV